MKTTLALLVLATACGGGGSNGNTDAAVDGSPDDKVFTDAPMILDTTMITVSGTATASTQNSDTPLAGVVVAFFKSSDETHAVAMMTTDATGAYTLTVPTGGVVVDGFIEATISGYATNYIYPTAALAADWKADVNMVTTTNFGLLGAITGQSSSKGFITANVLDGTGTNVTGATISSSPASTYKYTASGGIPSGTTATGSDGVGYYINAPVGEMTISAAKTGMTFKSVTLKSHANALTVTNIAP